jgi:YVTN family beta-propeller protein
MKNHEPFSSSISGIGCILGIFLYLGAGGLAARGAEVSPEGRLLVMNKGDRTVSVIEFPAGRTRATIPIEGVTGHEIAASADGKVAFVPIFGNAGVGSPGTDGEVMRVVQLDKGETVGTVAFGKGVRPHCVVFEPVRRLCYVTAELENAVMVVDPVAMKVVGRVPTGAVESHMLVISRDGKRGYTANVGPGTVSVLDFENRKLLKVVSVARKVQRISLSVDDKWVFTADQDKPRLAMLETASNEVKGWIELPGIGYGTATTPDGKHLLVALIRQNKVGVVDLETRAVIKELDVSRAPQEIVVRPDGLRAYASCDAAGEVAEIDLKGWSVVRLIKAGQGADGLAWANGL